MSKPREGSRAIDEGIIVSLYPDYCHSPHGVIPYIIYARQMEDANTAPTVLMTGKRSHKVGSLILQSHGDEAGIGGGVQSGTVGGICRPKTHSSNVLIEGQYAVRHDDEWWMNNGNTIGKLQWIVAGTGEAIPPGGERTDTAAADGGMDETANSEAQKAGISGKSVGVVAGAGVMATAGAFPQQGWPARPMRWPALPAKSPSLNLWWTKASPSTKRGAGLLVRGIAARAIPFIGDMLFPTEMGDGTLAGALRHGHDAIVAQVQALRDDGVQEAQVGRFYNDAWEAFYQKRPELFQEAIWGEVFPDIATQKEEEKEDAPPRTGITADNVRVTAREKEQEPCFTTVIVNSIITPESAQHIRDAQASGHPRILTIYRLGAQMRRAAALRGIPTKTKFDRDEYPPAMFLEGGVGVSVRYVPLADNRSAGAQIGNQLRSYPEKCKVELKVAP